METTAEDQGSEVQSSNSISVVRVKEQSVFTSQIAFDYFRYTIQIKG